MGPDVSGYVRMATALAAAGAGKATETVTTLMTLADRDALVALVRTEVDQVIGRMGLVREDELAALRRHVERLEQQVTALQQAAASAPPAKAPAKAKPVKVAATEAGDQGPAKAPAKPPAKKRKRIVVEPGA